MLLWTRFAGSNRLHCRLTVYVFTEWPTLILVECRRCLELGKASWRKLALIAALTVLYLLIVVAFDTSKIFFHWSSNVESGWISALPMILSFVLALFFENCKYDEFVPPLSLAMRSCAIGLMFYLVVEPPDFTLANVAAADLNQYVRFGYIAALMLGFLSAFRPSFVFPTAVYILSTRYLVEAISGFPLATTDIKYMLDMSIMISVTGIAVVRLGIPVHSFFRHPDRQLEVLAVGLALHLANYFWSGLAKIALGPRPWTWMFENKTYNSILFSAENRTLPIADVPWLINTFYYVSQKLFVPLNAAVIIFQIFAIICIWRLSWLRVAAIAYDILHVGIYLLGGLFFWPWIWNNLTVLISTAKSKSEFPNSAKAACVFAIVLAGPMIGSARLAWFDVADVRESYLVAVTSDAQIRVPASFFLSHSYSVSHGYFDQVPRQGQYPFTIWASARDYSRNQSSGTCRAPLATENETDEEKKIRSDKISLFLRAHHTKMIARQGWPWWHFYFRSHHHPSNPFLYSEFNHLNLRDVKGYKLIIESICLGFDGGLTKKVMAKQEEYYPVD